MSMKFFAGLQDFLGLYDTSSSSNDQQQEQQPSSPTSTTATTPTAAVTAATSSSPPTILSVNSDTIEIKVNSPKYISDISIEGNINQYQQRQLLQKVTLDDSEEIANVEEKIRQCTHRRSVHFPDVIVTNFYDAPTNTFANKNTNDIAAISTSYLDACKRLRVDPIQSVQEQIACFHQVIGVRQESLSLKGHRLSSTDMECLEEIFNKVQFDMLDFEYTFLDDDSAVCLGEMLEFYDSAVKLNLSFNKQINLRGWQAICKAVRDAPSIQYLNLRYTSLSDRAVPVLARALRSQSSLTILHLENVSLAGRNLILVGCALKGNTVLRELYLGENNLQPADGAHIYQIIITSVSIQLLDLRNNQLQDGGLRHICDALRHRDTAKNSALSALILWNNRITSSGMDALAQALKENGKLETLNIGNNSLLLEGIIKLKPALQENCSLQRLGLQATNLDCQSAIVLAECLADNKVMIRLDLRDNPHIGSAGLLALHLAMKMNTSLTVLNLDTSVTQSNSLKVKEYQEQFKVYYEEIKMFCERNKEIALKKLSVLTTVQDGAITTGTKQYEENVEEEEDDEKEEEEKDKETKVVTNGRVDNLEIAERNVAATSHNAIWLLGRSSSLTCAETVDDISERVAQMTHYSLSIIERIPDSITTIKKQANESHPALFLKSELSKCPSLPSITSGDHPEVGSSPRVRRISRRFTVSTSSLNATNPRDVAQAKSRFKVEQVGPSIQKASKAKSDDCIPLQRSLSESSAVDTHESEFFTTGSSNLQPGNSTIERTKELSEAVIDVLIENKNKSNKHVNQSGTVCEEKFEFLDSEERPGNPGFLDTDEISGSFRSQDGEKVMASSQDMKKSCEVAIQNTDEENPQPSSVQFTAVVTLQHKSNKPAQVLCNDATFVTLELGLEKSSVYEQTVGTKHALEQAAEVVRTCGNKTQVSIKPATFCSYSEMNFTSHLPDETIIKEVIGDLINYVVYEISDDDSVCCKKISFGATNRSKECSPTIHSSSSGSRSSSNFFLNTSGDVETDEEAIHCVVRNLVRDILLQEKEFLRQSLRKKRRHLVAMPKVDRSLCSWSPNC